MWTLSTDFCFACGSPSFFRPTEEDPLLAFHSPPTAALEETIPSALDEEKSRRHLENALFVGGILFRIPKELVVFSFSNSSSTATRGNGGVPEIEFCEGCHEHVEQARVIYQGLLETLQTFRTVQRQLVEQVKRNGDNDSFQGKREREEVERLDKWKQFIVNYDYGSDTDPFLVENLNRLVESICVSRVLPSASPSSGSGFPVCKSEIDDSEQADEEENADILELEESDKESNDDNGDEELEEIKEEKSSSEEEEEDVDWIPDDSRETSEEEGEEERDITDPLEVNEENPGTKGITDSDSDSGENVVPKKGKRGRRRKQPPSSAEKVEKCDKQKKREGEIVRRHSLKITHHCKHCNVDFSSKKHLESHISKSHPELVCNICGGVCLTEQGLKIHIKRIHKISRPTEFKCTEPSCDKVLTNLTAFKDHLSKHRGEPGYECPLCGASFFTLPQRRRHHDKVHVDKGTGQAFVCQLCQRSFDCGDYLRSHMCEVHGHGKGKLWKKGGVYDPTLPKSVRYPNDRSPRTCEQCGKTYVGIQGLKRHIKVFHEKKFSFFCEVCGKGFLSRLTINNHLFVKHKLGSEEEYRAFLLKREVEQIHCNVVGCRKSFWGTGAEERLQKHRTEVHGEDGQLREEKRFPFFCEVCGKGFLFRVPLNLHLFRVHKLGSGEEHNAHLEYQQRAVQTRCTVVGCRKFFWGAAAPEKLKRHVTQEHGEDGQQKRYQCHVCAKEFALLGKFKEHLLIHENKDTRPFICETCGKGFVNRGNLRYHQVNVHKAEKLINRKPETKPRSYLHKKPKVPALGE